MRIKQLLFRFLCAILSIGFLFFGVGYIYNGIMNKPFNFDSTFKVALASFFCGMYLLVKCIKGK